MKATPISQQPVNRFTDLHWPKDDDQRGLNIAVERYFHVAISENGTDEHGSKLHIFEDFDPQDQRHLKAIFDRDFIAYCERHNVKPIRDYMPDFVEEQVRKWTAQLEGIRSPKFKRYIRSYIYYLNKQKDAEMEASEAMRRDLTDAGYIGKQPRTYFTR